VSRIFKNPFLLVSFIWHRGKEGSPRPPARTSPSPSVLRSPHRHQPPMSERRPAGPPSSTPPCRDAARSPHARPDFAMAAVDARPGRSATDHLLTHHLATDLAQASLSNSPN
jgi:hypothetical protein